MHQLDIFSDSGDVILRNDIIVALRRHDGHACRAAITRFAAAHGKDADLPVFRLLAAQLLAPPLQTPDRAAAATQRDLLEAEVTPAARKLFGDKADDWLAPLWRALASAVSQYPLDPADETLHAAPLALRARDWQAAAEHGESIASWRRQPAPLAWQIEARFHLNGLNAIWPLLSGLAWMAPLRAEALARRLPDVALENILHDFDGKFENTDPNQPDFAWFPAWLLITHPHLSDAVRLAQAGTNTRPERCARHVLTLLTLERQGNQRAIGHEREKLKGLHAGLFAQFMQRR